MKYVVGFFILAISLVVFRAHYYPGWLITIAVLYIFVIVAVFCMERVNTFSKLIFAHQGFADNLSGIIMITVGGGFIFSLYFLNTYYCQHLLYGKTVIVPGIITKEGTAGGGRYSKGYKVWIYRYSYNSHSYRNNIPAEGTSFRLNDTLYLKISTFDPTVMELVQ